MARGGGGGGRGGGLDTHGQEVLCRGRGGACNVEVLRGGGAISSGVVLGTTGWGFGSWWEFEASFEVFNKNFYFWLLNVGTGSCRRAGFRWQNVR